MTGSSNDRSFAYAPLHSVTIGGHTYPTKQGGFAWIDFGNLLNEAKRRMSGREIAILKLTKVPGPQGGNVSSVHLGVLQWFSSNVWLDPAISTLANTLSIIG